MKLIKIDESDERMLYINPESVVALELRYPENYAGPVEYTLSIKTMGGEYNIPLGTDGSRKDNYCSYARDELARAVYELNRLIEMLTKDKDDAE